MSKYLDYSGLSQVLDNLKTWITGKFSLITDTVTEVSLDGLTIKRTKNGSQGTVGTIRSASTSQTGVVKLADDVTGSSTSLVPTQLAVKTGLDGKADKNGVYSEDFHAKDIIVHNGQSNTVKIHHNYDGTTNPVTSQLTAQFGSSAAKIFAFTSDLPVIDTSISKTDNGHVVTNRAIALKFDDYAKLNNSAQTILAYSLTADDVIADNVRFTDNYGHKATVVSPASLSGDISITLPSSAGTLALKSELAISNQYTVVQELDTPSASTMDKIYLVPSSDASTDNAKDEYITIRSGAGTAQSPYTYAWELIGSTKVDMTGYWQHSEAGDDYLTNITPLEIDQLFVNKNMTVSS